MFRGQTVSELHWKHKTSPANTASTKETKKKKKKKSRNIFGLSSILGSIKVMPVKVYCYLDAAGAFLLVWLLFI